MGGLSYVRRRGWALPLPLAVWDNLIGSKDFLVIQEKN